MQAPFLLHVESAAVESKAHALEQGQFFLRNVRGVWLRLAAMLNVRKR